LFQFVKDMPNSKFYFDGKELDRNDILHNKGKKIPTVWYHGTTFEYALDILGNGLRAKPEKSLYKIKHDKTVFMSSNFRQAKWYAEHKSRRSYGSWANKPCVLKIDGSKIDSNKIVYDYDVYNAHAIDRNDSVYNDRMGELGLTYDRISQTITKPTDPRKYMKVGYRGIIMPNAITSVYLVSYNGDTEMTPTDFVKYINDTYVGFDKDDMKLLNMNEAAPEVDEYEIGAESDNPPVGGNGYHINESASFDSSEIGAVNYSWDFDEDEYQEWLQEAEYENTQESLMEYINDNVTFELEYLDNETYHTCGSDYVDYNELEDMFGSKMQNEILKTCMNDGSGTFETVNLYSGDDVDVSNKDSINNMAMKLLRHGDYFKDCRGFILTNGVVVYTETEHNEICRIPNINNKFDFIRMGNIRVLPKSIDIGDKPTSEQRDVLRRVIASYADEELYLDIYQGKSSIGAKYMHPDWRYVMGEIDRFYSEGIKPQGNEYYESRNKNLLDGLSINESVSFDSSEIGAVMDINAIAKKIQTKGNSSYILTNGEVITFRDHNEISKINGMTVGKFLNLGNIRIGNLGGIELIKKPTKEQIKPLKKHIIEFNGSLFLDIASYKEGRFYAEMICGAEYKNANPNRIINDILAYFDEGIKPQGNRFYESKKNKTQIIENKYDDLFNKANYDLQYFLKQGKEKYGLDGWYRSSWMEKTHPEISVDPKDIKIYTALNDKLHKITKLWTDEDNKEEREKGLEQPKENYDIISLAIEEFGLTSRLSQAGYILPDGKLLNLGSDGYRETDHRQIAAVYKQNGIKIWNDEYRYNYVVDFMNHGAIRCDVNSGILDMTKEPTNEQFYAIKDFVRKAVDVDIDFTDDKGNTLHSVSYSDAKPQAVVADIMRYYEDGIKPMGNVQYEANNNEKHIVENFDFEVDSSEIDLSSFKKKHELVPNIWKPDGKLDSRIRLKLLDIADDFWKYVNLTWVEPSGIILTGSICNFNWSQYSDIDLHLIVDFDEIDEKTEFVRDYLDAKKNEWNSEHSGLQIMGYQVELYVQNLGEMPESNGIYDLEENDWIKEPNPDDIKSIGLNKFSIKDKAAKIMTIIDDMYNALNATDDSHKIETIGDDAQYLWKKVKAMRKASLESNGESGAGNIVYKILRRTQYLDKLFRLFSVVYDRNNSIVESVESNNNVDVFALAKERFGVTNDIRECGYILPDGSMLDFSGRHMVTGNTDTSHLRGRRGVDHRDIGDLNWDADMTTKSGLNINMADFIRMGAIRIHCSNTWSSINLFKKPTREQVNPMLRLIQYSKGNVTVEIGDGDNSYEYAEWDEANSRRVVNDIIRYFDGETINLVGNVTESKVYDKSNSITESKSKKKKYTVYIDGKKDDTFSDMNWKRKPKVGKGFYYGGAVFKIKKVTDDSIYAIEESKFNDKEIIKEYLEKDYNLPLYKYFKWASTASSCEKARDLAYSCSCYIDEYIKKIYFRYSEFENLLNDGEFYYEDESLVEMFLNMLEENKLCDHFISIMQDIVNYYELPSWCTMNFNRIVKNEWCIHFGSDSESIAKEGFTGGTPEIEHLAYTNAGVQKSSAGYDFAFLIDDRNVDYNGYGDEAVIFRTSGVEIYHYGDNQNQVIFWGPNVKSFIPIHQDNGDWVVYGQNGQVLVRCGRPSEIALWATENLPQYRKQIMTGKNGYIPKQWVYNKELGKSKAIPYPIYRNESIKKYLTLLKENFINEEWVGDGNSEHNPYKKRWDAERKALKDFLSNYGKLMQSRENGKLYKCYYDKILSQLIGYNYCICIQWDNINMKPKSVLYIRALDKFTPNIKQVNFDARGHDNVMGSYDDLSYQQ